MMKLLLAVIATCALVVSPTCIKIKHQLRSNAPTIHVLISNGNTQMTSQVGRNGSHRFITDNLSNMTLAPAGSQTIQLSYDEIFPTTDAAVCTEVHPVSAGGCADGVCCKVSISMYTITDAIIMTARVNNRKADGNPQFWKCEQEIPVSGVTNTEASLEELVTDILGNETPLNKPCYSDADCGQTNTHCDSPSTSTQGTCTCDDGYEDDGSGINCKEEDPCTDHTCNINGDSGATCIGGDGYYTCDCTTGFLPNENYNNQRCTDRNECTTNTTTLTCHQHAQCTNTPVGSYTCTCNSGYYGNGYITSEINTLNINPNSNTGEDGTGCTDNDECATTNEVLCSDTAECNNTPGSYECVCNEGYYGNGLTGLDLTCTDYDECQDDPCSDHASCNGYYPPGGYTCTCDDGYMKYNDICYEQIPCGSIFCPAGQQYCSSSEEDECKAVQPVGQYCNGGNECNSGNCYDHVCVA